MDGLRQLEDQLCDSAKSIALWSRPETVSVQRCALQEVKLLHDKSCAPHTCATPQPAFSNISAASSSSDVLAACKLCVTFFNAMIVPWFSQQEERLSRFGWRIDACVCALETSSSPKAGALTSLAEGKVARELRRTMDRGRSRKGDVTPAWCRTLSAFERRQKVCRVLMEASLQRMMLSTLLARQRLVAPGDDALTHALNAQREKHCAIMVCLRDIQDRVETIAKNWTRLSGALLVHCQEKTADCYDSKTFGL